MEKIIWGIDPGSAVCGVSQLTGGSIGVCFNEVPGKVYNRIMSLCGPEKVIVVIEDIFPYSMRLTPAVIETCKLIGELTYRFNANDKIEAVRLIPRNSVKKWIFDTCPEICNQRIEKKILYKDVRIKQKWIKKVIDNPTDNPEAPKGMVNKNGEMRKPSFHWIDDRIIIAALKKIYKIPTPKPGKSNIYGLTGHNWQALACIGTYLARTDKKVSEDT